jgi:polyferredoxin
MPKSGRLRISRRKTLPARRWIIARKIAQYSALVIFIFLFVISTQPGAIPSLVNLPMRLDPLLAIAHLLSSRVILSSFALALIIIALSVIFGRAWCGWICPLGTILDMFSFKHGRQNPILDTSNDKNWRKLKYSLLMAIIIAALFGNLTLLIFDPLTILLRTLSTSLWPALDHVITALEMSLVNIASLEYPIVVFDAWIRPAILPIEPAYIPAALLYFLVFVCIIVLNIVASRFWCRYLCPLGGLLGLISKASLFRRQVKGDCKGCALCERVCPTGTIDPERNFDSDPSECTLCLDCMEACPRSSIAFIAGSKLALWREYDPNRRQALATFGLTIASLAVISADSRIKNPNPHLIRPPGVIEDNFLSSCIRCAECMRACPTHALQPALLEGSLFGLWSPILVPRLGYCDYACNKCGQVCPTQAILPLPLEEKRNQVIGKAYIDQNRCIAWADHADCIVCEEMCPLPEKAIKLEVGQWQPSEGNLVEVQLPIVNRDLCIGCGICEYKCPVTAEAAIRIYTTS